MISAPVSASPGPRAKCTPQPVLDLAITFRLCSLRAWCTASERRVFRTAMRAEALKWRQSTDFAPGSLPPSSPL